MNLSPELSILQHIKPVIMKPVYFVYLLCIFIFISCGDRVSKKNRNQALVSPFTPNLSYLPGDTNNKIISSVNKSVKINPAHGQPGHRCDFGVGDILPENPLQTSAIQASFPQNQQIQANSNLDNSTKLNPQHGQPGHRCDIGVGAPLNSKPNSDTVTPNKAQTPNIVSSASGLNPKHGEPGHRCDIAVGEPLNSKTQTPEQKTTVQSLPQTPVQKSQIQSTDTTTIAKGMNPKHGQPGHRCDIAVGAPLDSKSTVSTIPQKDPNTTTTQNTSELVKYPTIPNTTPQNIQVQSPAKPNITTNSSATTAAGMNPKHGQPGHRCDIAVGAPLSSKPKQ